MARKFFWEELPRPRAYEKPRKRTPRTRGALGAAFKGRRALVAPLVIFLVCFSAYALLHVAFVNNRQHYLNVADGDEPGYLMVADSIVADGDLSPLNNYLEFDYLKQGFYQQAMIYPENRPFLVFGTGGRMVYSNARLFPLLLVPGYWFAGYAGAVTTIILFMSLAALLTFLILRRLVRERVAIAATLVFFLTYPAVVYSRRVYPEAPALFLLALALWASLKLRETGRWWYAGIAGLSAALMFQLHLKFAPLSVALLILVWLTSPKKARDLTLWLAPVILSAFLALAWTRFLFGPGIVQGLTRTISSDNLGGAPFWGIFGMYLDRGLGLFVFAPLYLAFIPGVPVPHEKHELSRWWIFIPVCIVVQTIAMGWFGQWHGGASPVPRYLMPIIPLFVICAAVFYEKLRSRLSKVALLVLLALQVVLTIFAFFYPLQTFGMTWHRNNLLPRVFGKGLANFIQGLFPVFYPMRFWTGFVPLLIWLVLLAGVTVHLRRKSMGYLYTGQLA